MKSFVIIFKALAASAVTKARVFSILAVSLGGALISFAVSKSNPWNATYEAVGLIDKFGLNLTIPIASLIIGTAALGNPIEDGTYVYLWLRPLDRWKITVAAFAVTVAAVVPLAAIPSAASVLILDSSFDLFAQATFATVFASLGYAAIFVLIGHLTSRGLAWGVGYLLIFEQFIARGGDALGFFAVHSHAVSILSNETNVELGLSYYRTSTAVIAILAAVAVFLGVSAYRQQEMDVA